MADRAQSEAIGIILLTGVIVITVGTASAVVLSGSGIASEERVNTDVSIEIAEDGVGLTHEGGDSVAFSELRVVVRHGNETWRPAMNASGLRNGDGDGQFDPGERWIGNHTLDADVVTTVQVFHTETGTLLAEARRYPRQQPLTTTPSATESDTTDPSVQVTSPDGDETVEGGADLTVEWTATDANTSVESIDIQYSPNGGSSWQTLVTNTANDGSQSVEVPADSTDDARIRVRAVDAAGNDAFDRSSAFTVDSDQPSIDSISPNTSSQADINADGGGWENVSVSWRASDPTTTVGNVTISIQNVSATVATVETSGASGTIDVPLPDATAEDVYDLKLRVEDETGNVRVREEADAVVVGTGGNDTTPPGVTVESPDGGEVFRGGNTTTIQWTANDTESGVENIDITYSPDGGTNWNTVVTDTENNGSYTWTIPSDDTTHALIRVNATDAENNSAIDTSNATFTIDSTPPSVDTYTGLTANKNTDNVTVGTFDASDNTGLSRVEFTVYNGGTAIGSKTVTLSGTTANLSSVEVSTSGIQPNKDYTVEAVLYDDLGYSVTQNETASAGGTLTGNEVAYDDANGNGRYDDGETTFTESDLKNGFDSGSVDLVVTKDFSSKNKQGFDIKANSVTVNAGVTVSSDGDVLLQGTDSVRLDGATIDSAGQVNVTTRNGELSASDGKITVDTDSVLTLTGSGDIDVSGATVYGAGEVTVVSKNGEIDARDADAAVDGDSVLKFDSAAETRLEGAILTARATPSDVTNAKMKVTADDVTTDSTTALYDLNGNANILYWTNGPTSYQDTNPQPGEVQGKQP